MGIFGRKKKNTKTKNENGFIITENKQLLDKNAFAGCIVSDKISKDGWKVGYMYRDAPVDDMPDIGWCFLKGDEDEEYMNNPNHHHIFSLNELCNYDPDVIKYLDAPEGSVFIRVSEHEFEMDDGTKPIMFFMQE